MANGVFTIKELRRLDGNDGERFDWFADKNTAGVDTTINSSKGGVRACPQGVWNLAGKMRTSRTDYAGNVSPSEQILGPSYEPQDFSGVWDDRYNFTNYAYNEMKRFEAMARRGNTVNISFQGQAFEGVIVNWVFGYKKEDQITYQFTVSIHDRTDAVVRATSPKPDKSPVEVYDEAEVRALAIEAIDNELKPTEALDQQTLDATKTARASLQTSIAKTGATIDQNEIQTAFDEVNAGLSPYKRIATHFRNIQTQAAAVATALEDVRSDTTLIYRTTLNVLDFEDWQRSLSFNSRILMNNSYEAAKAMDRRDEPDAKRLYRPQEKESLYDISRRFYGTPWAWSLIYERNALTSFELTGDELLIIPDRAQG
jgi:nucleoid-associated protein YgaU